MKTTLKRIIGIPKEIESKGNFYFDIPEGETKKKVIYDCNKCGLKSSTNKPIGITEIGNPQPNGLVFVGEAPGEEEQQRGINFVGRSGQLLRSTIKRNYIKHCSIINAVACRPPNNKMSETYVRCCRTKLKEKLLQLKPNVIICLGEVASNSVLNLFGEKQGITKLRNRIIPNYEFNCLVFCTNHPANILRNPGNAIVLEKDLKRIFDSYKRLLHKRKYVNNFLKKRKVLSGITIKQIRDIDDFDKMQKQIEESGKFSFDYETTNLKPYDDNFEVWCMSFAIGKKAWVIYIPRYEDPIPKLKNKVFDLLNREDLLTIIQNVKYEELVTRRWVFKDSNPRDFAFKDHLNPRGNIIRNTFDTMLATHVIDERGGCTSLDFQNLVRFGLPKYNKKVKKYLEIKNKNDKKNTIHLCPPDDLIQYSGLDSITSFANYELLDNWLDKTEKFRWCYDFILKGHEVFANMSWNGLPVDEFELDTLEELLDSELRKTYDQIENLPDIISYLEKNKNKVFTKPKKNDTDDEEEPINIITTIKRKLTMRKKDV